MEKYFTTIANRVAGMSGRPITFLLATAVIVVWALVGPFFNFSDTWQLVINTGTTIITFLMVFLIQNTQNRDGAALQTKLDELIRVSEAKNKFVGIEHLTESEVCRLRDELEERINRANIQETAASARFVT
jgi:low affinity Fe/Cu permease